MANIKDFIKKIGNSAVSLEEQQQALAQVEKTIIEAKQKRTEVVGKNADMVIQALKTIEAKLEAKLTELNNTPAKQGIQGPVGKDGKDGKDGKAGRDGLNGKDGTDGKDGVDGKDGISVVDAKIDFDGSLVVYLSNGSEIDCGQILQPEVAKNIIISSGGSGTSQVVTDTLVSLQNQINTLTGIDGVLGDMAQQNANAVAITGGTINGTTIGATTPSSIVGTTITGQTGRLNGTGSNFFTTTTTFANFGTNNGTVTLSTASTDPFGGTSVYKLVANTGFDPNTGSSAILSAAGITLPLGVLFTQSIYFKAAEFSALRIRNNNSGEIYTFTIGVTPTATAGVQTPALTLISNGWYRASWTFVTGQIGSLGRADNWSFRLASTGDGTSGILISSPQLEIGSTLNSYIPNTGAFALYGTPTLSFSGVSTLGLESNGALFLQPAGTGAIQAQATTSTTAGGNVRGANAVDWQTSRNNANQVASSAGATISGGVQNISSGIYAVAAGGVSNGAGAFASVVSGGWSNFATGNNSAIVGGYSNTAAGYFNFIGSGSFNSGTANTAVTTQSGTMNATTAVTLSGSNANIKVGQYIVGTSIAQDTYVAAISGTALTLSKNASGSSTSTLSFFTPHGVVVGGGNNQATGSYSFIGGGGDAGTAANRNVASGDWSFVGGGTKNSATNSYSSVLGGQNNSITTNHAFIGGGINNSVSNSYASVVGGYQNTASGANSVVTGGTFGTTRSITGFQTFTGNDNALGSGATGTIQAGLLVLGKQTTDATATVLTSNNSGASGTNQVILPNNSAYYFKGSVIANVTGAANGAAWSIEGAIMRGANAASTVLIDTPSVNRVACSAGATAWVVAVTADTTNGGIRVTVTGVASTTIRWVCKLETTEVTF